MIETWVIVETNSASEPRVHFGGFSETAADKIAARIRSGFTEWDHDHDCELFVKCADGQPAAWWEDANLFQEVSRRWAEWYSETIDNIATQIGSGYGARCLEDIDDIDREEMWKELPARLYRWFWDHDRTAVLMAAPDQARGGWPTEDQVTAGLIGLGYKSPN